MAYDAGAAVGRLTLDISDFEKKRMQVIVGLGSIAAQFRAINRTMNADLRQYGVTFRKLTAVRVNAARTGVREQAKVEAAARVSQLAEAKIAARQQAAVALANVRSQNKITEIGVRAGYQQQAREAAISARSQMSRFQALETMGVRAFNNIGTAMTRLRYGAQLMATAFVVAFASITYALVKVISNFAEFEQRMRKATSVTKYTEDQFKAMSAEAETAAKRWGTPARDAADAFLFLGRAGLTAEQQLAAMPAITAASKAMMEDLEETAEGTVNVMNAFNIAFGDTPRVVDMMTEAVNSSTMNLHEFLVSLSYAAKPAASFGNTIQDTAAMIGIAANAGIRGSKAGTALRYSLTQLAAPTAAMRNLMHELNINVYDSYGKMRPLVDIIATVQDRLAGASEQVRNYTLKTLFGQRALSTMIALFDLGADGIRRYSKQIEGATDVTTTTAQKQMMAIKSQMERMREYWDALKRHIVQSFAPDVLRVINIIIHRIEDWTATVDKNQKKVREFMRSMVTMFTTFAKLTVGAAVFMLVTRVLGGIVMLLQAILSPLGLIIATLATLMLAWKSNFLSMRDVGRVVFDFLKKDALSFFEVLINKGYKAVAFLINQMARLGQPIKIGAMASSVMVAMNKAPSGDKLTEQLKTDLFRELSAPGKQPEEVMKELLRQHRGLYEELDQMYHGPAMTDVQQLSQLIGMIKQAKVAVVEPTVGDILDSSASLTKAISDGWDEAWAKVKEGGLDAFALLKDNIKSMTGLLGGLFPPEFWKAFRELGSLWKEIVTPDMAGPGYKGAPRHKKSLVEYKAGTMGKLGIASLLTLPEALAGKDMYGRMQVVYRKFLSDYTTDWKISMDRVAEQFKTQQQLFVEMFNSIHTGWVDAFDSLMRKGSSFVRFMDSIFTSILDSFRQMVANMLAQQMMRAVFGGGGMNTTGEPTAGANLFGQIWGGLQYLWGGTPNSSVIPGFSGGGSSTGELDYLDELGGGVEKRAPGVSLNITNNGVPVTLKPAGRPSFNGRELVLNYVMEEAVNNPGFRDIISGRQ